VITTDTLTLPVLQAPGTLTSTPLTFDNNVTTHPVNTYSQDHANAYEVDAFFQVEDESLNLTTSTYFKVVPELTCSQTGAIPIYYSLQAVPGHSIPSWVSFDIVTGKISGLAPRVSKTTVYPVYVVSHATSFTGEVKKLVNIRIETYSKTDGVKTAQALTTTFFI